ncbi:MAG: anti-sigma factor, partial [Nocardioides sp.]
LGLDGDADAARGRGVTGQQHGVVGTLGHEPDGEMIAAGFMPEGPDNTVLLSGDAATADGVGITVEPEGGSTEPNLDSAVVLSFDA